MRDTSGRNSATAEWCWCRGAGRAVSIALAHLTTLVVGSGTFSNFALNRGRIPHLSPATNPLCAWPWHFVPLLLLTNLLLLGKVVLPGSFVVFLQALPSVRCGVRTAQTRDLGFFLCFLRFFVSIQSFLFEHYSVLTDIRRWSADGYLGSNCAILAHYQDHHLAADHDCQHLHARG